MFFPPPPLEIIQIYLQAKSKNTLALFHSKLEKRFISLLLLQDYASTQAILSDEVLEFCKIRRKQISNIYSEKYHLENNTEDYGGSISTKSRIQTLSNNIAREEANLCSLLKLKSKKCVVLLPEIPSIQSEFALIEEKTDLKCGFCINDDVIQKWDPLDWYMEYGDKQVLLLSPKVFLSFLKDELLSILDLSLIIFDDCSFKTHMHSYSRIIQEFYFPLLNSDIVDYDNTSFMPRIFAAYYNDNLSENVTKTAELFNCTLFQVETTTIHLQSSSNVKKTFITYKKTENLFCNDSYDLSSADHKDSSSYIAYVHHMSRLILMYNHSLNLTTYSKLDKMISGIEEMMMDFGLWSASYLAETYANAAYSLLLRSMRDSIKTHTFFENHLERIPLVRKPTFDHVNDNIKFLSSYQESEHIFHPSIATQVPTKTDLSSKLRQLFRTLKKKIKERESFGCAIVVDKVAKLKAFTILASLLLHGSFPNLVIDAWEEEKMADNIFENKQYIILMSNISGLKSFKTLPSYMIFVSPHTFSSEFFSLKQNLHSQTNILLLVDNDSHEHLKLLVKAEVEEKSIKPSSNAFIDHILGNDLKQLESSPGALSITKDVAEDILAKYIRSTPKDKYTQTQGLFYTKLHTTWGYSINLQLPSNTIASGKTFSGQCRVSEKISKQAAAYEACKFLLDRGAIREQIIETSTKSNKRKRIEEPLYAFEDSVFQIPIFIPHELQFVGKWKEVCSDFKEAKSFDELFKWMLENTTASLHNYCEPSNVTVNEESSIELFVTKIAIEGHDICFGLITHLPLPKLPDTYIYLNAEEKIKVFFEYSSPLMIQRKEWRICRDLHLKLFGMMMNKQSDKFDNGPSISDQTSKNIKFPEDLRFFKLLPMKKEGIEIDWNLAKRIVEFSFDLNEHPRREDAIEDKVVITLYNSLKYFAKAWKDDLYPHNEVLNFESKEKLTYSQYYSTKHGIEIKNHDIPLIEATHNHAIKNHVVPRKDGKSSRLQDDALYLIPELTLILPISMEELRLSALLPSILFKVEAYLTANSLLKQLQLDSSYLLQSFSLCCAPAFGEVVNYERLETLGDSFLKFASSTDLFLQLSSADEGTLTSSRSKRVNNRFLCQKAFEHDFVKYLQVVPFYPRQWAPPEIKPWRPKRTIEKDPSLRGSFKEISSKMAADMMESIVGFLAFDISEKKALEFLRSIDCINSVEFSNFTNSKPSSAQSTFKSLEAVLKYQFNDPLILEEAFTHTSKTAPICNNYQRLEFLGDALLDWVITRYLFSKYTDVASGELSDLRQTCVNAGSFGRIAVENGLHKYIQHNSPVLDKEIQEFVDWYLHDGHVNDSPNEIAKEGPKVLCDVFESLVGAIFVDTHFDTEKTWNIVRSLCQKFIDKHANPSIMEIHPVRQFYEQAQKKGMQANDVEFRILEKSGSFNCNIYVKRKFLVQAVGISRNVAKRLAAIKGLQYMQ